MLAVEVALCALAVPVVACSAYLLMLALASRKPFAASSPDAPRTRFDVIVPAHDEALGIARTVASLRSIAYPKEMFRVVVVADNCSDDTAARAAEAGAVVWERRSPLRGKGQALAFAFERSRAEGFADAVVVIDADTEASPNLLIAFDAKLSRGAFALQAYDGVLNAQAHWRTQLMTLGFALVHAVRASARDRLGLSAGLHGNGMCFTHALLAAHPHQASSVVEDLEFGLQLAQAGVRVHYVGEASVLAQMPTADEASRTQRQRWEAGRKQLARKFGWTFLARGVAERRPLLVDTGLELLVPPLSNLVAGALVGLALSAAYGAFTHHWAPLAPFAFALFALATYVVRGWQLSGLGFSGARALAFAPLYMGWKWLSARRGREASRGEWVRTAREGPQSGGMQS